VLLTNEEQQTLMRLRELIPQCIQVDIIAGFMSPQGFELLADAFRRCLASGGSVDITVGRLFESENYDDCRRMIADWPERMAIRVSDMPDRLVHGKVYLLRQRLQSTLIIGSSNLTVGGLQANEEINVELPIASLDLERVGNYIDYLKRRAISLEAAIEEGRMRMDKDAIGGRLDPACVSRIRRFAEAYIGWVSRTDIDQWCDESDAMLRGFNEVLNLEAFSTGGWTGERFKTEFLMKKVWAVTEAKHTELWPAIRSTSGNTIVKKLLDMLAAADRGIPSDEVIELGRIPYVIGQSIASEILHKCRPDRFVIKNKRSHWGMAFILDQGDGPSFPESMTYSTFQMYVDLVMQELTAWLSDRGVIFDPRYRYYIGDRFFMYITEDEANKKCISMYYRGRSDDHWWR
jgi:hypothetical protein